ncbi:MAG: Gfo/Idh/MocA family oxidoreductase [Candidatus Latescibacterota bacterium]|nr:MAG: Gfo/Idh/MocA family oxidoreductase [Candidatus Latescibacterota bacterium]
MRVAVLGTGHLGREHARIYASMPDVDLAGVYDIDPNSSAATARQAGCRVFRSPTSLFASADAVSVCVPTPAHAEVGSACLEAGLHVLMEKPISDTVTDARTLRDLAAKKKRVLQVGHIERFNPAMQAAAQHLDAPRFVECHRLARFGRRGADVAVVLDLMIHDIDLLLAVIRGDVLEINASGVAVLSGSTDIANARLRFRNGCVANITASRISLERMRKIRFFQQDSYLSVDLLREQVAMYRKRPGFDLSVFHEAMARGESPDLLRAIEPVAVRIDREEPLQAELYSFVSAVRERRSPVVGAEDGIRALEVACEIERLLREEDGCAS